MEEVWERRWETSTKMTSSLARANWATVTATIYMRHLGSKVSLGINYRQSECPGGQVKSGKQAITVFSVRGHRNPKKGVK